MSNILGNLKKILSARYGREVRQAIHDAIHDCYEDGKSGAIDLIAREQIQGVTDNVVAFEQSTEERFEELEGKFTESESLRAVSGPVVTIGNAANANIAGLKIYGKTVDGESATLTNIKTHGKNLCDGINQSLYLNNAVNFTAALENNSGLVIPTHGLGKFTISTTVSQARYRVACTNSIPTSSGVSAARGVRKDGTSDSITIDTTGYKYLVINATDLNAIQVEQGSVETTFEAYKGSVASVSHTLRGVATTDESIATYTDESGQMWIADELDFVRGKKIQRISHEMVVLADPIETDLTEEEIEQARQLRTYEGYTFLETDSIAEICLTYFLGNSLGTTLSETLSNMQKDIKDGEKQERKYIFIGDSIAVGYNPEPVGFVESWQPKTAALMGLTQGVDYFPFCEGGSGFLKIGDEGHTFKNLIEANIDTFSGIEEKITDILIVGGYNDLNNNNGVYSSIPEIESAIEDFMAYCKTTFPNAQVTIGFIGFSCVYNHRLQFCNVVKPAYDKSVLYGARIINNLQFCLHHKGFYTDGVHINEEGQETLAIKVTSFLKGGQISATSGFEVITFYGTDGESSVDLFYAKLENDKCIIIPYQGSGELSTWIISANISTSWTEIGTYTYSSVLFGGDFSVICCPAILVSNGTYYNTTCMLRFGEEGKLYLKAKQISGSEYASYPNTTHIQLMFNEVQINSWLV